MLVLRMWRCRLSIVKTKSIGRYLPFSGRRFSHVPKFLINLANEEKERKGGDMKRNNSKFHLQSVSSPN